jgi:hypothetical protein
MYPMDIPTNQEPQEVHFEFRNDCVLVFTQYQAHNFHVGHYTLTPPVAPQPEWPCPQSTTP